MSYQWFKDDKVLTDADDYNGSTTTELAIVGSGSQVKGEYKCKVTNKLGEVFSNVIRYGRCCCYLFLASLFFFFFLDPFAMELKLKGLKDSEITKLIGTFFKLRLHVRVYIALKSL